MLRDVLDDNQILFLLSDLLKNEVVSFWPIDTEQLVSDSILEDELGQVVLADLTFKLIEVVISSPTHNLLSYFR